MKFVPVLVAIMVFAAVGCDDTTRNYGSGGVSDSTSVRTQKPRAQRPDPKPPTADEIAEQAFIMTLRSGDFPFYGNVPDAQIINIGRALCADLDDGYDPYALAFQASESTGADEVESAGLVGAAMGAFCPRHKNKW